MEIFKKLHGLILLSILFCNSLQFINGASLSQGQPPAPIVEIGQGKLKGSVGVTRAGDQFAQFLGIPYVTKPNRFELAGPPPKWEGVRDATKFGSKCIQYRRELKEIIGQEDCLYINVFTKEVPGGNNKTKTPLPVYVFIHGGSFLFYSGEVFSPKYFLDEPVILVTFNYRLGVLGFLNLEERGIVPNLGLKDQVAALKWIQDSIGHFGGDTTRVTIFGNSAGSASVSYHLLSPLSKDLFHGAISQSGVATCGWSFVPRPRGVVENLATKLNCPSNSTKELINCLKSKPVMEIITQQQKILGTLSADPPVPFAPSAENYFVQTRAESSSVFLPDSPDKLMAQGNLNKVPFILGINSADGLTFAAANILNNSRLIDQLDKNWDKITPAILAFGSAPNVKLVGDKVREFYFGKDKITDSLHHVMKLTELLSDRNFFQCGQNFGIEYSNYAPTYLYYFTRDNGASFLDHFGPSKAQEIKGAKHQDEIQYLTPSLYFPDIGKDSKSLNFSKGLIKLWTSLGTEGKPSTSWGSWLPISSEERKNPASLKYFYLNDATKFEKVEFGSRVQFWNSLPIKNEPPPPPFIVGEIRKSPTPPSPIGMANKLGPLVIGHSGSTTPIAPITGTLSTTGSSQKAAAASSTSSNILTPTTPISVTTPASVTAPSPVHSHVFPDLKGGSASEATTVMVSSSTTKAPGLISKIFGGK